MTSISYFIINTFTKELYKGNPAAVCLIDSAMSEGIMQKIAREIPVPTTAFVTKIKDDAYSLKWFTPEIEIPICGHGTIASAFVLWQQGIVPRNHSILFQTASGHLHAKWEHGRVEIAIKQYQIDEIECTQALEEWIGSKPIYVGKTELDYIVELSNEDLIAHFEPNFSAMKDFPVRGICITSQSNEEGIDIVSRFFSPAQGIDEDHVNGSSHGALGPYWSQKLSKHQLVSKQLSKRGGIVYVTPKHETVEIAGSAILVLNGKLSV
ncbi:PhzF family phenazine biosynthesis protein [Lysinibacillus cavernae]|uniref:PhzF family phenazine biosynthesis protein n=1 Tax=Lysinibacillus cavernae TaxID=2666135 RepID=UPI0012D9E373|nr:PhzF family phenazine biosynthesis protein [Lysinibacillus cavernae]